MILKKKMTKVTLSVLINLKQIYFQQIQWIFNETLSFAIKLMNFQHIIMIIIIIELYQFTEKNKIII